MAERNVRTLQLAELVHGKMLLEETGIRPVCSVSNDNAQNPPTTGPTHPIRTAYCMARSPALAWIYTPNSSLKH